MPGRDSSPTIEDCPPRPHRCSSSSSGSVSPMSFTSLALAHQPISWTAGVSHILCHVSCGRPAIDPNTGYITQPSVTSPPKTCCTVTSRSGTTSKGLARRCWRDAVRGILAPHVALRLAERTPVVSHVPRAHRGCFDIFPGPSPVGPHVLPLRSPVFSSRSMERTPGWATPCSTRSPSANARTRHRDDLRRGVKGRGAQGLVRRRARARPLALRGLSRGRVLRRPLLSRMGDRAVLHP